MKYRFLIIGMLLGLSSTAQAWQTEYFGGVSFGNATLEKKPSEIAKSLENKDWPAASVNVDDGGNITKAYAGAFFSRGMGVRVAFVDLGDAKLDVSGGIPANQEQEFADAVLDALPNTGTGFTLSVLGRFPISDRLVIHDWAGVFIWDSEVSLALPNPNGSSLPVKRSNSGTDFMLGAALEYLVGSQFGVRLEAERYNQDNDGVTMLGLGLAYYF